MARHRKPGELPLPPTRGPEGTTLGALLASRRFRLGAGTDRIAHNLAQYGGERAHDAAAWLGHGRPPAEAPAVALGEYPGTLGPRSFGFLNNVGGVAALDAPLPALPRRGNLALVVPARDALPDVAPLVLARGLGISWIISVGDGDPAEAIAFLSADPATLALALVLGPGARGASLRQVLGAKPAVVWGGDTLCRAVVRRAGSVAVDGIDGWLARAALLDAGVEPGARAEVVVVGGGRAFVEAEVKAAGLKADVVAVDDRVPEELATAVRSATAAGRAVVLVAGGPPSAQPPAAAAAESPILLTADLRHPEHLRALVRALALAPDDGEPAEVAARVDSELAARVHAEVESALSDHDAKRLLKAHGARVTRQAPTATPTGAVKLAKTIGTPVLLAAGADERVAESLPEVRRLATLLLQTVAGENPSVMVREHFPEVPRTRIRIAFEKGLGLVLRVGEGCALLPLSRSDALALAATTAARRASDQRAVAELFAQVAACAEAEQATFELEIYVGAEPCIITASGALRR